MQALMTLFVLSCKDGWVNIMYDGLDAVGVDQQVTTATAVINAGDKTVPQTGSSSTGAEHEHV